MSTRGTGHSPRYRHTLPQTTTEVMAHSDTGNYSTSNHHQTDQTRSYHSAPSHEGRYLLDDRRTASHGLTSNYRRDDQSSSYHSAPPHEGRYLPDDQGSASHYSTSNYCRDDQSSSYRSAPPHEGRYLPDDQGSASHYSTSNYQNDQPNSYYFASSHESRYLPDYRGTASHGSTSNYRQNDQTSSYHSAPPHEGLYLPDDRRTASHGLMSNYHQNLDIQLYQPTPPHPDDRRIVNYGTMSNHQENLTSPYQSAPPHGRYLSDDRRTASRGSATHTEGSQTAFRGARGLRIINSNLSIVGSDQPPRPAGQNDSFREDCLPCPEQSMYDHVSGVYINGGRHSITGRDRGNNSGEDFRRNQSAFAGAEGVVIENANMDLIAGSRSTG